MDKFNSMVLEFVDRNFPLLIAGSILVPIVFAGALILIRALV